MVDEPLAAQPPTRPGEQPWTEQELAAVRADLLAEREEVLGELRAIEGELAVMMSDVIDGPGDDQADAGARTFEREQELSLAATSQDILDQVDRAIARMDHGQFGVCEKCGNAIGKVRLQAFPRATMCLDCKQRDERR